MDYFHGYSLPGHHNYTPDFGIISARSHRLLPSPPPHRLLPAHLPDGQRSHPAAAPPGQPAARRGSGPCPLPPTSPPARRLPFSLLAVGRRRVQHGLVALHLHHALGVQLQLCKERRNGAAAEGRARSLLPTPARVPADAAAPLPAPARPRPSAPGGSSPAHGRCDCSELIRRPPAPRLSALPAPRALPAAVPPARTPRAERQPRDRGVSSAGGAQPRVLSAPGALPAPRTPHPLPARCERSARAPNGP